MTYQAKKILKEYQITPYHSKGQNFLIKEGVVNKILELAALTSHDTVLEIGAGLGALTVPLCQQAAKVVALEWDKRFVQILENMLIDSNNIQIIQTDALNFDYNLFFSKSPAPYIVMGNLPYYLATALIQKLLPMAKAIDRLIFMVQKEVGDRLIARRGEREYGMLSLITEYYSIPEKLLTIPKDAFYPKPKVDSCIIKMTLRKEPPIEVGNKKFLFSLIKAAFTHRRKTLVNALKSCPYLGLDSNDIKKSLEDAQVSVTIRPQELSLAEFAKIAVSHRSFHSDFR
ncbi:MAG: 16S rRNA (adenine(1518)-N(6)/adenine(1519)-N(6))-dimethyltransferase RsmA [bacterium]